MDLIPIQRNILLRYLLNHNYRAESLSLQYYKIKHALLKYFIIIYVTNVYIAIPVWKKDRKKINIDHRIYEKNNKVNKAKSYVFLNTDVADLK